jgi:hypothetical protein
MALSEMAIRHAQITGIDYTLGDSDGLTLNVTASGGKIWLFRYYWTGKQKRMSLGCYPQISLTERSFANRWAYYGKFRVYRADCLQGLGLRR